jgi:DNA topoisomerase III
MSYAKVLGANSRKDGYLEGNGYLVSWCVGHLVELAPPNVYDAKYVKWSIADLPILPQKWQYLVSASTKKQFGILKKLMHRPDVDSIVNSCDSGREGELISFRQASSRFSATVFSGMRRLDAVQPLVSSRSTV